MKKDYVDYFGTVLRSAEYEDLLSLIQVPKALGVSKKFGPSTEYICFYEHGIALCFENEKLDSIDFYKEDRTNTSTVDPSFPKYHKVSKEAVPKFIPYDATAGQLVEQFGEPLEKGGGLSSKMDIWLRWRGFQVEISNRDWDQAKDVEWASLTIFSL